jgi:hypothetical protein
MAGGIDRYPVMRGSERESLVLQRKKGGERRFCRWGQGDKLTMRLVAGLLGGRRRPGWRSWLPHGPAMPGWRHFLNSAPLVWLPSMPVVRLNIGSVLFSWAGLVHRFKIDFSNIQTEPDL